MKESRRKEGSGRWKMLLVSVLLVIVGLVVWRVRGDAKLFDLFHIWTLILAAGISIFAGYVAWDWDAVVRNLQSKGTLHTAGAFLQVLLVAVLLVSANYFASRNYKKWDLTEEQIHTLAQQSLDVARGLDQEVQVIAFYKSGQPERETFAGLIELYREASPRISVRFVDPDADPITTRSYNIGVAGTVVLESGDRKQTLQGTDEQDITRGLIKLTRDTEKTICFTSGHGERDYDSPDTTGITSIRNELSGQGYHVKPVNIAADHGVDPVCTVLIIAGPTRDLVEEEIAHVGAFVESKAGGVVVLLDPQTPDQRALLRQFNVRARNDIVVDANPVNQVTGQNFLAPIAAAYGKHPISEKMSNIQTIFPLARSLESVPGAAAEPAAMNNPVVYTSQDAWGETDLSKGARPKPDEGKDAIGPLVLMIAGYKLVKTPEATSVGDDAAKGISGSTREARFVIVGDSDFVTNQYSNYFGNADLFLNAVSWAVGEGDLISIRPRKRGEKPINLPTESFSRFVALGPTLLLPVGLVGFGIYIWARRRRL